MLPGLVALPAIPHAQAPRPAAYTAAQAARAHGTELYRFRTGGPIGGGVITHEIAGRQYVAVTAGSPSSFWVESNPGTPTIVLFALPQR